MKCNPFNRAIEFGSWKSQTLFLLRGVVTVVAMGLCVDFAFAQDASIGKSQTQGTTKASSRPLFPRRSVPAKAASTKIESPTTVSSIVLRSSSSDEAFAEPIDSINVACGESGIVGDVLVKLGDEVTEDQLLFELDKTVLGAMLSVAQSKADSKAQLKASQVELETKTIRYQKLVELKKDGAGSAEEVIKSKADMDVAQQNVVAIQEQTEQYRLEMKQIEAQIEQRRIRSPMNGVVVEVKRKIGEFISINDPHVVTVVQLDTLKAVFHLPTTRAAKINQGDAVDIVFTETNQVALGIIEYVSPVTKAASGRVRVEVLIDNQERKYRSGLRCQIRHGSERTSMMSPNYK
jgi:RND family efflux transporter MFP subunit